ncbi:hypothetical protein [Winslowiella iniecta]|uniref:Uncharacterized protein n=1 Tax=Winslowiella iniecta TaxID=1560201 RepID=A0A0L7T4R3_9GAMM|nr:hypothetical protein [Winslowiella iniecta]KOC87849.1 hypothetical protein NG42_18770 [Winslowiella iniecta]KOC90216.1 hypothetical protein NG43_17570 [Winslowiella iniecta]
MKKHKGCLIIFIALIMLLAILILFLKITLVSAIGYTEKDFLNYHLLTDEEVKNALKISQDYYFFYYAMDGNV